jgi:hypothetical protein
MIEALPSLHRLQIPRPHRYAKRCGRGICKRCRLRQRNTPATPDHSAAFWREDFKDGLFQLSLF